MEQENFAGRRAAGGLVLPGDDFTGALAACGVPDPERTAAVCERLRLLLVEANRSVNLTRITSVEDFRIKHVLDSLSLAFFLPELRQAGPRVADVGCGAGFPAIPLAAAFPELRITAIDSTRKKVDFVRFAAAELGLDNLNALHARCGEIRGGGGYHLATARAVAEVAKLVREIRGILRPGGAAALYKTPDAAAAEIAAAATAAKETRMTLQATPEFELPGGARRCFVIARRMA